MEDDVGRGNGFDLPGQAVERTFQGAKYRLVSDVRLLWLCAAVLSKYDLARRPISVSAHDSSARPSCHEGAVRLVYSDVDRVYVRQLLYHLYVGDLYHSELRDVYLCIFSGRSGDEAPADFCAGGGKYLGPFSVGCGVASGDLPIYSVGQRRQSGRQFAVRRDPDPH